MHIPKSIVVTADFFVMSPSDAWNIYSFICRPCPNLPLWDHSFQCYFPGAITNDCFALSNGWFWCSLSGKVSTSGNDIIYCIDWSLHRMVSMEIWLKWSCQYYANLIYKNSSITVIFPLSLTCSTDSASQIIILFPILGYDCVLFDVPGL